MAALPCSGASYRSAEPINPMKPDKRLAMLHQIRHQTQASSRFQPFTAELHQKTATWSLRGGSQNNYLPTGTAQLGAQRQTGDAGTTDYRAHHALERATHVPAARNTTRTGVLRRTL